MWEPLHQDATLTPVEVHPLNAIPVRLGPVEPVVVGRDPVGPADALGHDAGDVGAIHPAAVHAGGAVAPVRPEHQAEDRSADRLGQSCKYHEEVAHGKSTQALRNQHGGTVSVSQNFSIIYRVSKSN